MKIGAKAFYSAYIFLILTCGLIACSNNEPEITDDEIIKFLGTQPLFGSHVASPTISKQLVDCSELISGSKNDVVKDMPVEYLGQMKTACREQISSLLKDPTKKNFGLTLRNFENKSFAARLIALKNSIDLANHKAETEAQAKKREEEAKEKAALRLKSEDELAKITSDYSAFTTGLDEQFSKAHALCDTLKNTLVELKTYAKEKEINISSEWIHYDRPMICAQNRQLEIKAKSQEILTTLLASKIEDGFMGTTFPKPYLGSADPKDIQDQMQRLNTDNSKVSNYFNELKNKI